MYRLLLTSVGNPWSGAAGGGAIVTHAISETLARRGHKVTTLYIGAKWPKGSQEGTYRRAWLPARVHSPLTVAAITACALAVLARRTSCHLLNASGYEGAFVLPALPRTVKVVMTSHHPNLPILSRPGERGEQNVAAGWRAWRMRRYYLDQRAALRSDAVVAVSQYSAEQLVRNYHVPSAKVHVVYNGVETSALAAAVTRRSKQIVFAGRFDEGKGIDVLLRAIALGLGENVPPVRIIGAGVLENRLRELVRTLGVESKVRFVGWLPHSEVISELAQASICAMPSRFESFGLVAAEAMGVGTPVVAADAGALPEMVVDGVTGVLVPPGNAEALAGALRRLLGDNALAAKMGAMGRERIKNGFTWDRAAERLEELYAGLLSGV